jgi:hypothetical protein
VSETTNPIYPSIAEEKNKLLIIKNEIIACLPIFLMNSLLIKKRTWLQDQDRDLLREEYVRL